MNYLSYWLPPNIASHGTAIDSVLVALLIFITVFFTGWSIYFFLCLWKFRRGSSHPRNPRVFRFPWAVEVGFFAFEIFLLIFYSIPLLAKMKGEPPGAEGALRVRVYAQQYAWVFHYPGDDGVYGRTLDTLIDDVNFLGLDRSDSAAKDDLVTMNTLAVPRGRTVWVELFAKDVVHGFNIPVVRIKQDAIPGVTQKLWFQANQEGTFDIACAQLCGIGHYRMRGQMVVHSQDTFVSWYGEEKKAFDESLP